MIEITRLNHIQICIPIGKENETREFYTKILGLREIPKPAELISSGGLWYRAGDIQFHIGVEDEINNSKRHPAFEVINLENARRHLVKNMITIKDEIQIPGQTRFSFFDPFNNRIELLQKT
jgi:catechol 2,3-dioxygenase-like lactoylglutathione lyase family enzyme